MDGVNSFSFQSFTDSFQSKVSRLRGESAIQRIDRSFMLGVFKDSSELQQACEERN